MIVPILLILVSLTSMAVVAFGVDPRWTEYGDRGLDLILFARRFQWPLVVLSLVASIVLIGLVIGGKRRAWWLIGLGPILALFVHRFSLSSINDWTIVENPTFVSAAGATFLEDEDYVVGVRFNDVPYAFPYATLFHAPAVVHTEHDQRMILLFSPYANRALAYEIDRTLKPRELDVVSMPANALLLYNSRLGEFINGVTGLTTDGEPPRGFDEPLPTTKTTWKTWRTAHPETQVMPPITNRKAPTVPIQPSYPVKADLGGVPAHTFVAVVGRHDPVAIRMDALSRDPVNVTADGVPVIVFRDGQGTVRAFDRRIDDLSPQFRPNRDRTRKNVAFTDADSNSGWNEQGVAVDGELKGKKLAPVPVGEDLYWGVMKYWYPGLQMTR